MLPLSATPRGGAPLAVGIFATLATMLELQPPQPLEVERALAALLAAGSAEPDPWWEEGLAEAQETMDRLAEVGIDITAVTDQLEREGVRAFADSFVALRKTIDEKCARLRAGTGAAPRPF